MSHAAHAVVRRWGCLTLSILPFSVYSPHCARDIEHACDLNGRNENVFAHVILMIDETPGQQLGSFSTLVKIKADMKNHK